METPDPPSDTPGASKQVVSTPHDIPRSLRGGGMNHFNHFAHFCSRLHLNKRCLSLRLLQGKTNILPGANFCRCGGLGRFFQQPKRKTQNGGFRLCVWNVNFIVCIIYFLNTFMDIDTLEVKPPFFIGWFTNHHYFSRGLSSSKRNHHF